MIEFRNESGLEFKDISTEAFRVYTLANGDTLRIDEPQRLHVSDSGGHRLFDGAGNSHYIPTGWLALTWQAREGKPHFVL